MIIVTDTKYMRSMESSIFSYKSPWTLGNMRKEQWNMEENAGYSNP